MPLALGVGDRVGDGVLDDLDADDLARVEREREADRADPAVEVVDALAAGQPGELGGRRVEPLGHLGVRLEEGLGRDLEAQGVAAELELLLDRLRALEQLVLAVARGLGNALGLGPDDAVGRDRRAELVVGELALAGDEARLDLAGAAALATTRLRRNPPWSSRS